MRGKVKKGWVLCSSFGCKVIVMKGKDLGQKKERRKDNDFAIVVLRTKKTTKRF